MFPMPSSRTHDMRARTGLETLMQQPARCGGLASLVESALIGALGRRPTTLRHELARGRTHTTSYAKPTRRVRASSVRWRLRPLEAPQRASWPVLCPVARCASQTAAKPRGRSSTRRRGTAVCLSASARRWKYIPSQNVKISRCYHYTRTTLPDATCSSSLPGPACEEHRTGARPSARYPLLVIARHSPHTVLRSPADTGRLTTCMHMPRHRRLHALPRSIGGRFGEGREEKGSETSPSMCRPARLRHCLPRSRLVPLVLRLLSPTHPVSRDHVLGPLASRLRLPDLPLSPLVRGGLLPPQRWSEGEEGEEGVYRRRFRISAGASATFLDRALGSVSEVFAPQRYTHRPSPFSARVRADQSPSTPACSGESSLH
ncbi:hypothetical protein DFH08DRAFT_96374 [Mycena albidolilacea]|uniref:Uncharacterized protein n=1 Tax=Mycena albidolilacea TaxID=1033008 RepID=A0AAD6YYH0_9AGAR|nr:hypothetical protein DFH08DRAFT_96374 [Mycena albidolilacea]